MVLPRADEGAEQYAGTTFTHHLPARSPRYGTVVGTRVLTEPSRESQGRVDLHVGVLATSVGPGSST